MKQSIETNLDRTAICVDFSGTLSIDRGTVKRQHEAGKVALTGDDKAMMATGMYLPNRLLIASINVWRRCGALTCLMTGGTYREIHKDAQNWDVDIGEIFDYELYESSKTRASEYQRVEKGMRAVRPDIGQFVIIDDSEDVITVAEQAGWRAEYYRYPELVIL